VKDLDHLHIRRTKTDKEVRDSLKGVWADHGPSESVTARATEKERAVFEELAARWIPRDPSAPSICAAPLAAHNFLKTFLPSHKALQKSLGARRRYLARPAKAKKGEDPAAPEAALKVEREAIVELERLTTFDDDEYVHGALRAGASGFLVKDMALEDILAAVRVVAAGEGLIAPTVTRRLIREFAQRPPAATATPARSPENLTDREREVLTPIDRGLSNAGIAMSCVSA
jgi:hypothetical protein